MFVYKETYFSIAYSSYVIIYFSFVVENTAKYTTRMYKPNLEQWKTLLVLQIRISWLVRYLYTNCAVAATSAVCVYNKYILHTLSTNRSCTATLYVYIPLLSATYRPPLQGRQRVAMHIRRGRFWIAKL